MEEIENPPVAYSAPQQGCANKKMEKFLLDTALLSTTGATGRTRTSLNVSLRRGEQSLENYDLYKRYCNIIEDALQDF